MPPHATVVLPGQDKSVPPSPMSGASQFVVSCEVRLSEVGLLEIRKPQVKMASELACKDNSPHNSERRKKGL